jgi:hypothetical protein
MYCKWCKQYVYRNVKGLKIPGLEFCSDSCKKDWEEDQDEWAIWDCIDGIEKIEEKEV